MHLRAVHLSGREQQSSHVALARECRRYHLDYDSILRSHDQRSLDAGAQSRSWWDYLIVACGLGIFGYLAVTTVVPSIPVNAWWAAAPVVIMLLTLGWAVWRLTRQPAT